MATPRPPIAVLGAGSWGTALALHLARSGNTVRLWGRDATAMQTMQIARENARYLPSALFPESLSASADLKTVVDGCPDILIAVPSHAFRSTVRQLREVCVDDARLCWASKGFEHGQQTLLSDVVREEFGKSTPLAVLSGPSFAKELAAGLPTAIALASDDKIFRAAMAQRLHNDRFRVYLSDDMIGVQIGGAVKNVLAIAAGMCDGLGFGANARTALITRGLVEMTRLGLALGAQTETFYGMAGLGDLLLTCTDNQSRNRRFGLLLGQGKTPEQALQEISQVVEGHDNTAEVYTLAQRYKIEMPIVHAVYRILHEGVAPKQAAKDLLSREMKDDGEF